MVGVEKKRDKGDGNGGIYIYKIASQKIILKSIIKIKSYTSK